MALRRTAWRKRAWLINLYLSQCQCINFSLRVGWWRKKGLARNSSGWWRLIKWPCTKSRKCWFEFRSPAEGVDKKSGKMSPLRYILLIIVSIDRDLCGHSNTASDIRLSSRVIIASEGDTPRRPMYKGRTQSNKCSFMDAYLVYEQRIQVLNEDAGAIVFRMPVGACIESKTKVCRYELQC